MANWNLPTTTSGYLSFVSEMNSKFVDSATLQFGSPTNLPSNTIRFNRSTNIFEEWNTAIWQPKIIGISGGGTGATTAGEIRTNLGLGSMSTQNSNAVAITGGSITGVTFSASDITSGIIALSRGGTGAALSLGGSGTVLLSNGSQVIFSSGVNIVELNASNLTTGIVPIARLSNVGFLGGNNVWTGGNTFNSNIVFGSPAGRYSFSILTNQPTLNMESITFPVGRKIVRIITSNGDTHIQSVDDAYTAAISLLIITNEGYIQGYGGQLTNLHAPNITSGIVNTARLGSGPASSATFLRGDGTWAAIDIGGGVTPEPIPSGLIAMFATNCPAGWTRVASLDNRFPLGSTGFGNTGGSSSHYHNFSGSTDDRGLHSHNFSASGSATGNSEARGTTGGTSTGVQTADAGGSFQTVGSHTHDFNVPVAINVAVNVSGNTDNQGNHNHNVSGSVSTVDLYPPYLTVVYCQKN